MAEGLSKADLRVHAQQLLDGEAKALLDENQLTMRVMRKLLEEKLRLPEGSLDSMKKDIATIVKEALGLEPVPPGLVEGVTVDAGGGKGVRAKAAKGRPSNEKENHKPVAAVQADDAGAGNKAVRAAKHRSDEQEAVAAACLGRDKGKGSSGKRAATRQEVDSDGGSGGSNEEEQRPKKRTKESGRGSPGPSAGDGRSGGRTKSVTSRAIEQMKDVCKRATIKIGPSLYTRNKTVEALEEALEELLARHGLNRRSGDKEIGQVRRQLERDRDLEGIDTTNIISLGGGRPRRAAAASINFREMFKQPKLDSEEEEEDQEQKPVGAKQLKGGRKGRSRDTDDDGSEEAGSDRGTDDSGSEGDDSEDLADAPERRGGGGGNGGKAKASSKAKKRREAESDEEEAASGGESEDLVDAPDKGARKGMSGMAPVSKGRRTAVVDSDDEDEAAGGKGSHKLAGRKLGRGSGSPKENRKNGDIKGEKAKASGEEEEEEEPQSGKRRAKPGKAATEGNKAKARRVVEEEEDEEEEDGSDSEPEDDDSDFEADDDDV